MNDIILKIDDVSKEYRLGSIGATTFRDELKRLGAKILKKDDPTKKIGAKKYGRGEKFLALCGVSFEVKRGERVGIIGQNGAGKSTLLKLISRITSPTGGTIYLDGRVASMLEVGTGFHPELTGRENIYMNGAVLGMTKKEIEKKIEDIIDFSEVRDFIDTPVKRYSSGMYVKLAFSVAAHLDSEIIIMDEVLAVGDMAFQQKCIGKMRDVSQEENRTILYVSHNMNTIRQLCDRVIVLDKGRVVFNGDVEEGISVYMDTVGDIGQTFIDLGSKPRHHRSDHVMHMESLELLDRDNCALERGEGLKMRLEWTSKEDRRGVKLIITIKAPNDNTAIASLVSKALCDCKKGERHSSTVVFDTSLLAKGRYFFNLMLSQDDGEGNAVILDYVARACFIDVSENDLKEDKINRWTAVTFGYIHYPELEIVGEDGEQREYEDGNGKSLV